MGRTSRGVFLTFPTDRVIFLSVEPFRGPLTINLSGGLGVLARLAPGDPVVARSASLVFPTLGQILSTEGATMWEAPPPPYPDLDRGGLPHRLLTLARGVLEGMGAGTEPSLLRAAIGLLDPEAVKPQGPLHLDFARLSLALEEVQGLAWDPALSGTTCRGARLAPVRRNRPSLAGLTAALEFLVGRGQGLTPAGDDLILGLILSLNRWQLLFHYGANLERLNTEILALTKDRTTSLSSTLIECASLGQADERLVCALDWLMTGKPGIESIAKGLLSWGSSSGSDSLAGMALALSHVPEETYGRR